ncbi:hypothetical protein NA57DRAFT_59582 [Rhizodiscina lignyota]|uniref:Uncharacterized protein n=1 Tax=Rhizodiscina lignyota TaxID=1504668 RepID=A0A9P4M3D1_9PEZI|nr:hypothetical protein NA57DRAFT_59582 [Rhizodiscina lignyota]
MAGRRFFVLDDTLASKEKDELMCLIVADKLRPLDNYAPSKRQPAKIPAHRPADLIEDLLPEPVTRNITKDHVVAGKKRGFGAGVGEFLGLQFDTDTKETVVMHPKSVDEYRLQNPDEFFEELMDDQHYRADVKKFLLATKGKKGYFVTGFLTTSDASWERTTDSSSSDKVNAKIPVKTALTAAGASPGLIPAEALDPSVDYNASASLSRDRKQTIGKDEIIAVAYSLVKMNILKEIRMDRQGLQPQKHEAAFGEEDKQELDLTKLTVNDFDLDLADEEEEEAEDDTNGRIELV